MDIENLLKLLNENDVEYVVIGAAAFPVHGYSRTTLDFDLFIRPDPENARRVREALQRFGYDVSDISTEDLLRFKVLIRQYMVEVDIHPFVAGVGFEEVWANKIKDKLGQVEVYFTSLDDLIRMKQAAARPKDIQDLEVLSRLKKTGVT